MIEWALLSIFLLFLVFVMAFLYASAISTTARDVPIVYGSYGVQPGMMGTPLHPTSPISVSGIAEATRKCDSMVECTSFYFDGGMMTLLTEDPLHQIGATGGVYQRQVPLKSIFR